MPNFLDSDQAHGLAGIPAPASLLSSDEQMLAGIRVTRAQFARMMGCSRQAVTEWVRAGRVTVGTDGRFDPRKAVADLLRTGDPARLRAKVLQPLADELAGYRQRIVELEAALGESMRQVTALRSDLAATREDADFHEGSASELCDLFEALEQLIRSEWVWLADQPPEHIQAVLLRWLSRAIQAGAGPAGGFTGILEELDSCALCEEEEGEAPLASSVEE